MVGAVERQRDAARAAAGSDPIALLTRPVGVGAVSASVLLDEVFHRGFANRRELAGHLGLGSRPYNSGSGSSADGLLDSLRTPQLAP